MFVVKTSAFTGEGVDEAMQAMAKELTNKSGEIDKQKFNFGRFSGRHSTKLSSNLTTDSRTS
jgi:hypothetical protein